MRTFTMCSLLFFLFYLNTSCQGQIEYFFKSFKGELGLKAGSGISNYEGGPALNSLDVSNPVSPSFSIGLYKAVVYKNKIYHAYRFGFHQVRLGQTVTGNLQTQGNQLADYKLEERLTLDNFYHSFVLGKRVDNFRIGAGYKYLYTLNGRYSAVETIELSQPQITETENHIDSFLGGNKSHWHLHALFDYELSNRILLGLDLSYALTDYSEVEEITIKPWFAHVTLSYVLMGIIMKVEPD